MPDIFLYGGEANPNDIELRDPTVADSGAITGTGAIAFRVAALAATALETFTATASETFAHPALAVTGAERFTATGAETFGVAALAGTGNVSALAITGTGAIAFGAPALSGIAATPVVSTGVGGGGKLIRVFHDTERLPGPPLQIYHDLPDDPLPEQEPFREPAYVKQAVDNTAAIAALYADGALTEDEFAVLLAA